MHSKNIATSRSDFIIRTYTKSNSRKETDKGSCANLQGERVMRKKDQNVQKVPLSFGTNTLIRNVKEAAKCTLRHRRERAKPQ